jgi:hypothetical protein
MFKRVLLALLVSGCFGGWALAQSYCTAKPTKLACELPVATHAPGTNLTFFNPLFGTQLSQLPFPSASSGFVLGFDKALGIPTFTAGSLGPVLSGRAETVGRHKLFLAFSYQQFHFDTLDGLNLKQLSLEETFQSQSNQTIYQTQVARIDAKINQYVATATYGITDRIDVSVALPFERVALGVGVKGNENIVSGNTVTQVPLSQFVPGAASGLGDLTINAKTTPFKLESLKLAVGGEFRFPTGDELNYLGSGAYGVKPYFVVSRQLKNVTPHLNVGYQWNSFSNLNPNLTAGGNLRLPDSVVYAAGLDASFTKRLTLAADFLGQHFSRAPRVSPGTTVVPQPGPPGATINFPTVIPSIGSYNVNNVGLGVKVNPFKRLVISGNVLIKVNEGGLRSNYIPLVGLSYTFF